MKRLFGVRRVSTTSVTLALLFALAGCAKSDQAKADDAEKLKKIPILLQQHNYTQAHDLLNQLLAEHPNSPGLEKFAQTLAPLWPLIPPRKIVPYGNLTADDQKLIDDLNKAALATPSGDVMHQVKQFNLRNPDYPHGWVLQACLALKLNRPIEGQSAARNLIELGGANSLNPTFQALLAQLDKQGWLPVPEAGASQPSVSKGVSILEAATGNTPPAPADSNDTPEVSVAHFIRDYFKSSGSDSKTDEASFYADTVTYFDDGVTAIDDVRADIAKYNAQYPVRTFTLRGNPVVNKDQFGYTVTCTIDCQKSDGTTESRTTLADQIQVQGANGGWKITSIRSAPAP